MCYMPMAHGQKLITQSAQQTMFPKDGLSFLYHADECSNHHVSDQFGFYYLFDAMKKGVKLDD